MNIDMGIMAAGTVSIKKDLNLKKTEYGSLGSVVYFGQGIGSIFAAGMLAKCNAKILLIICLLLNIVALLTFTQVRKYEILVASRTFTGLFQVFFAIYMPVWANTFGNASQQALWMTYLMITSPLGVIMGYLLCGFSSDYISWKWSFYIQSILMLPSFMGLILIPNKYFDVV